jgi:hypothetical protein
LGGPVVVTPESGSIRFLLALALLFSGSMAAQIPIAGTGTAEGRPSSSPEQRSSSLVKPNQEDDFHRRVAARWQAARKGVIEVYVVPESKDADSYRVRVVVTRAPSGSDGMTTPAPSGTANWGDVLKLDDELRVKLTSENAGALIIEPSLRGTGSLILHLDPGGHAEWTWKVRRKVPGVDRLLLQADVVYRRDFSPGGEPVVTYPSADTMISLTARPSH